MPTIKFTKEKKELEVPQGANLRLEAMKAGINLYPGLVSLCPPFNETFNCWGRGVCGTCRVRITKGIEHASPMTTTEWTTFHIPVPEPFKASAVMHYVGNEETMRLACCVDVNGDMEVETQPALNFFGENFFS